MANGAVALSNKVYPSGAAFAAAAAPKLPPWPGLFSMMNGLPNFTVKRSANIRATVSVAVPGGNPTIASYFLGNGMAILFSGKFDRFWAWEFVKQSTKQIKMKNRLIGVPFLSLFLYD